MFTILTVSNKTEVIHDIQNRWTRISLQFRQHRRVNIKYPEPYNCTVVKSEGVRNYDECNLLSNDLKKTYK